MTKNFLVGFYTVNNFGPDTVEVPCAGNGPAEYAALLLAIREKHPDKGRHDFVRTGSVIESRDTEGADKPQEVEPGATLRQLFDAADVGQPELTSREIGRVFFSAAPCKVVLTFSRASGSIGVLLLPRIKIGDSVIKFSNLINPQQLVTSLESIVRDVIGVEGTNLTLNICEKKS